MTGQWTRVLVDKDSEIVIVIRRESAAAVATHLVDAIDECRRWGAAHRADLLSDVMATMEEKLAE